MIQAIISTLYGIESTTSRCLDMSVTACILSVFSSHHLGDTLQWRHMNVMASQTTDNPTVCSTFQTKQKKSQWVRITLLREYTCDRWIPSQASNAEIVSMLWRHHQSMNGSEIHCRGRNRYGVSWYVRVPVCEDTQNKICGHHFLQCGLKRTNKIPPSVEKCDKFACNFTEHFIAFLHSSLC